MPKKKDVNSTTYVSAGNRVIASAMTQASHRPGKVKIRGPEGNGSAAGLGGLGNGDSYEKPPKIALSYEDYRKGHQEEETELSRIEAIAKELSSEYPLLDQPLILSILLDYVTPENVYANFAEIKDNLAVLEVSLVPDDAAFAATEDGGEQHDDSKDGSGVAGGSRVQEWSDSSAVSVEGSTQSGPELRGRGSSASSPGSSQSKNTSSADEYPSYSRDQPGGEELETPIQPNGRTRKPPHRSSSSRQTLRNTSYVKADHVDDSEEDKDKRDLTIVPERLETRLLAHDYGFPELQNGEDEGANATTKGKEREILSEESVSAGSSDIGDGDLDPAIFLTEMFPTIEQLIITHTLNEMEYDLSATIESLLSIERIRDVQERGTWTDGEDTDTDEERMTGRPNPSGRVLWQDSIPEPTSATDSEPEEADAVETPSDPPKSRSRKQEVTSISELGSTPKPLALTLPLYGKIHGHNKPNKKKASEGTRVPRVREISGQSDKPTYSSRAGRFAALAELGNLQRGLADSDTESATSNASGSRKSFEGTPTPAESFPPINGQVQRRADQKPAKPSLVLEEAEVAKVDSMATWLADLLPAKKAAESLFTKHMLDEAHHSASVGLTQALESLRVARDGVFQQIQQMGLLVDADVASQDCELCVRAANGDLSIALDLLSALQQTRSWPPLWIAKVDEMSSGFASGQVTTPRLFPPSPQRATFKRPQHPQNWRTVSKAAKAKTEPQHPLADYIPSYARGSTPQNDAAGSLYGDERSYDLKSCNSFAAAQRERRAEAMRMAGHYFRSGMKGAAAGRGKEVASYYATEARRLEADAMRWELQAARQIVERNSLGQDRWVIDIHHLTLVEASAVVRERVQAWHEAFGFAPLPSKPFRIITGVGKHSASHVAVLRPAIANLLDGDGWKVDKSQKSEGYVIVRGIRGA